MSFFDRTVDVLQGQTRVPGVRLRRDRVRRRGPRCPATSTSFWVLPHLYATPHAPCGVLLSAHADCIILIWCLHSDGIIFIIVLPVHVFRPSSRAALPPVARPAGPSSRSRRRSACLRRPPTTSNGATITVTTARSGARMFAGTSASAFSLLLSPPFSLFLRNVVGRLSGRLSVGGGADRSAQTRSVGCLMLRCALGDGLVSFSLRDPLVCGSQVRQGALLVRIQAQDAAGNYRELPYVVHEHPCHREDLPDPDHQVILTWA